MSTKKLTLVIAAFSAAAAMSGNALAADPVQDYEHDWSGFYIGAHAGYGEADVNGKYTGEEGGAEDFLLDGGGTFELDLNGFVGGVQAGHNWQSGNFVFGFEIDATFTDWSDQLRNDDDNETVRVDTDFVGTLRGRAGFAMDNLLLFGTAGVALSDTNYKVQDHLNDNDPSESGNLRLNDFGLVVGGGAEYAFAENWSIKAEGLYFIFDDKQDGSGLTHDSEVDDFAELNDAWMVRVGVNFHF